MTRIPTTWERIDRGIVAIEAEAVEREGGSGMSNTQGAAPRAEGLDVERLRLAMERAINNTDDLEAIAAEYARLAGAVPALQATPPDWLRLHAESPEHHDLNTLDDCRAALQATGEPPHE